MLHRPDKYISITSQELLLYFIVGASCFLSFMPTVHAQNTAEAKGSRLSPSHESAAAPAQTFAQYFAQVAAKNHVLIVAENTPLRLTITEKEKQTLLASIQNAPLQKSLRDQAAFFDYETLPLGTTVFVLRKKYTDPTDLPYVSMDEAVQLLGVANRIVSRFKSPFKSGNFETSPDFMSMAESFTEAQLSLMKQGKLPMSALTPEQRKQMWDAMTSMYIDRDGLLSVETSQSDMDAVRREKEGGFHRYLSPLENKSPAPFANFAFVYPTPKNPYSKMEMLPLCYQKDHRRGVAGGIEILFPKRDENGSEIPFHDASEPTEADRTAAREQAIAHASPTVSTFKALTERLNRQAAGKITFVVDDALATNPVSVFGAENADGESVFAACASAYELRVLKEEQNGARVLHLTTPFAARPNTLYDMPTAIRRILPGPYVHALHLPEIKELFTVADAAKNRIRQEKADRQARQARGEVVPDPVPTEAERKRRLEENAKANAAWSRWNTSPDTLEQAALRRFRATVEPKAAAAPEKRLPLSGLDETENAALTTALMRVALDGLQNLCVTHPPKYIEQFDELVLSGGGPYTRDVDNRSIINFQFALVRADGSLDTVAGFGAFLNGGRVVVK